MTSVESKAALVLDTSVIVAWLRKEPGQDVVTGVLEAGTALAVSAVNVTETLAKLRDLHGEVATTDTRLLFLGAEIIPFREPEATVAAGLLSRHRGRLALGDCACIATAALRSLPVLTADRVWAGLGLPLDVRLIR